MYKNSFLIGTQVCPKSKTFVDCEIQCNIANFVPLRLVPTSNESFQDENKETPTENLPEEESFEDADVDDYNPYQDLEDEEESIDGEVKRWMIDTLHTYPTFTIASSS